MPHPSAHAMSILLDITRRAWWSMVTGFAVLGAAFYGGATVSSAWRRAALDQAAGPDDVDVVREAERGIAEIESFLAGAGVDADRPDRHPSADAAESPSDERRRHRRA